MFRTLLSRILDLPNVDPKVYCPDAVVSMHQVFSYVSQQPRSDMHELLQRLAGECKYMCTFYMLQDMCLMYYVFYMSTALVYLYAYMNCSCYLEFTRCLV